MSGLLIDDGFCINVLQALMHFVWQGTIIWIVARIGAKMLRRRSPQARYTWLVANLGLMALCVPITFLVLATAEKPFDPRVNGSIITPRTETSAQHSSGEPDPLPQGGVGPAAGRSPLQFKLLWQRASEPATAVYALGVAWMFIRLVFAVRGGQRLAALSRPVDVVAIFTAVTRAVKAMGFVYTPAIAMCDALAVPAVVGVLRPMLLLPLSIATQLTPEQIKLVAMHELAHIKRHDHIVNLAQRFIESFLFFHPAVWSLSSSISDERESCCDEMVVAAGEAPDAYAQSLTDVARLELLRMRASPLTLAATGDRPSKLRQRVLALLARPDDLNVRLDRRSSAAVAVTCAALLLLFLSLAVRVVPASVVKPLRNPFADLPSGERFVPNPNNVILADWSNLHRAVVTGSLSEVQMLLANGANPNIQTNKGWTPLHFAACLNRVDVMRVLIEAGATVDARNSNGQTPLHTACGLAPPLSQPPHIPAEQAVAVLLASRADVNAADSLRVTPLIAAVFRKHVGTASELLARGANVDFADSRGRTPLLYACMAADLPMIKLLLANGARATTTDKASWNAIQQLVLQKRFNNDPTTVTAAAKLLLSAGVSQDLSCAIVLGDQQHVNETLTADPSLVNKLSTVTSNGWYPLHWAASFGDVDMIKLLLGQYHASATVKATDGQTPLHIALQRHDRSRDVIVAFLGAGADVQAKDLAGRTPLHLAAAAHDVILIRELLNAGAEINAAGNDGNSALHLAMQPLTGAVGSEVDAVTELLKGGADVNATNRLGRTPMHLAVVAERYDLMNAIIGAPGIDLNIRDNDGSTPLSLLAGKSNADKKLIKLLLDHGAKPN